MSYLLDQPWYIYVGLGIVALHYIINHFAPSKEINVSKDGLVSPVRNFKAEASQTHGEEKKKEKIIEDFDDSDDQLSINKNIIGDVFNDTQPALLELSKKRKIATISRTIMWVFTALFYLASFLKFQFFNNDSNNSTVGNLGFTNYEIIAIIVVFLVISVSTRFFTGAFVKFTKTENDVITKMINRIFLGFTFDCKYKISLEFLKSSGLFAGLNAKIPPTSYGYLSGRHKGVHINIVDVGIIDENSTASFSDILMKIPMLNMFVIMYKNIFSSQVSSSTLFTFRGMFCWAKFNKELKGQTVIMPNRLNDSLKKIVKTTFSSAESILLEDARFTKEFTVYGSDQTEARYILTASLMEKITEFKQKYNRPVMISFIGDKVHIAVENPNGVFAFPSGKLDSSEIITEFVNEIAVALSVVEDFRLNKRTAYSESV